VLIYICMYVHIYIQREQRLSFVVRLGILEGYEPRTWLAVCDVSKGALCAHPAEQGWPGYLQSIVCARASVRAVFLRFCLWRSLCACVLVSPLYEPSVKMKTSAPTKHETASINQLNVLTKTHAGRGEATSHPSTTIGGAAIGPSVRGGHVAHARRLPWCAPGSGWRRYTSTSYTGNY